MHKVFIFLLFLLVTAFLYPPIESILNGKEFDGGSGPEKSVVRVGRVLDGDTLNLTDGRTVRLKGIDCPESKQPQGDVATTYLKAAVEGAKISLESYGKDRYDRIVGTVYYNDININRFMVQQGLCWVYRQFADDAILFTLEEDAKNARIGLWAHSSPEPPWEWRRNN